MTQEIKTSSVNAKLVAVYDNGHKETCLQIPPGDSLNQPIADTESKQTGIACTDVDVSAKRSRTLQWVSAHCDPEQDEPKKTSMDSACLEKNSKFLPDGKVTAKCPSDETNEDSSESETTDEADNMHLVEMKAEATSENDGATYYMQISHIVSAQMAQAQLNQAKYTQEIKHLKAEGRKLLQLMRITRKHLMIENKLKMMND